MRKLYESPSWSRMSPAQVWWGNILARLDVSMTTVWRSFIVDSSLARLPPSPTGRRSHFISVPTLGALTSSRCNLFVLTFCVTRNFLLLWSRCVESEPSNHTQTFILYTRQRFSMNRAAHMRRFYRSSGLWGRTLQLYSLHLVHVRTRPVFYQNHFYFRILYLIYNCILGENQNLEVSYRTH